MDRHDPKEDSDGLGPAVGGMLVIITGGGAVAATSGSSDKAPVLTFIGGLLVALITWYATDRRQKRQLRAERDREERRIQADLAREKLRLTAERQRADAHAEAEREREDVRHLREFLDDLASEVEQCATKYTDFALLVDDRVTGRGATEAEEPLAEAAAYAAARWEAINVLGLARERNRRAHLRLPPDHVLVRAHLNFVELLQRSLDLLDEQDRDPVDNLNDASEAASEAFREWRTVTDEARKLVGARIRVSTEAARVGPSGTP